MVDLEVVWATVEDTEDVEAMVYIDSKLVDDFIVEGVDGDRRFDE